MTTSGNGLTNNMASALCYLLGILSGIAFLVIAPYNREKEVRFHAFQSILVTIAWIVLITVFNAVVGVLGLYALYFLSPLLSLAALLGWLYLMYSAYMGRHVVVPIVGPIAERQA